jgi:hypothetical protein
MVIYYNPHVDDFLAEPLQFRLLKRRALKKYGFMIDEARAGGKGVSTLIDGTVSGLIPETLFHQLPRWLRLALANLEFKLWKRLNGFGDEVKQVDIPEAPIEDVLLAFSYKAATGRFNLRNATLLHYRAVVFHLSHYFLDTAEKAANIRRLPNAYVAGDSDVTDIPYFKRYFDWYNKPFLILPFAVGTRFVNLQPWLSRDARAVATGSFHDLRLERPARKYADFMSATGATTYHPVRLALYESARRLVPWINCKISPYREYEKSWHSRVFTNFRIAQKKYFSIDIVDLYNKHRFAIVGEELSGFPALGAIEAIACGCILFAQPQHYIGTGLTPGVHFQSYDGSLDQILALLTEGSTQDYWSMSNHAARYILEKYSPAVMYAFWIDTFRQVK